MGVDYATMLTQALLQVLARYSMQCFPTPTSWFRFPSHGWSYSHSHGYPMWSHSYVHIYPEREMNTLSTLM